MSQAHFWAQFLADDGHQHIGADRDPYLGLYRIVARAIEVLDAEVLLDPLEEQLDSPAKLVELGDEESGQIKVVVTLITNHTAAELFRVDPFGELSQHRFAGMYAAS